MRLTGRLRISVSASVCVYIFLLSYYSSMLRVFYGNEIDMTLCLHVDGGTLIYIGQSLARVVRV